MSACGLMDGEAMNVDYPESFQIPPAATRYNLRRGAIVKLGFEFSGIGAERMWVHVTEVQTGRYAGTLESLPLCGLIEPDDRVEFEPRHVIDIYQTPTPE